MTYGIDGFYRREGAPRTTLSGGSSMKPTGAILHSGAANSVGGKVVF
jgi:hypothetical protein